MIKNNQIPIEVNKKPFETVYEIENYQIKKSPLSVAARSKVISKNSGGYYSENRESYGPCDSSSCPYSSRFYLKIGFSDDFIIHEKANYCSWYSFKWISMESIENARSVLRKFENRGEDGSYEVNKSGTFLAPGNWEVTNRSRQKQAEIMNKIQSFIEYHEIGGSVYESELDFSDKGCSNVIM